MTKVLQASGCDVVLCCGWMRILSASFCERWHRRCMNVHPSLLPKHAGGMDLQVHQAVLDARETESGCTVTPPRCPPGTVRTYSPPPLRVDAR